MTTLFGTIEPAEAPLIDAAARKKNGWLPLLTVLFLISYGLMTMLIVEQGQTIESQRALIRELLSNSKELSAAKRTPIGKNRRKRHKRPNRNRSYRKTRRPRHQATKSRLPRQVRS